MGDRGYYRRAGASSREMEHFEIEDAFRRIAAPELVLEHRIVMAGSTRDLARAAVDIAVHLAVRNISPVSAEHAYIAFSADYKSAIRDGAVMRNQPPLRYFEAPNAIVHPGTARTMATIILPVVMQARAGGWILGRSTLPRRLVAHFGCSNVTMRDQTMELAEDALLSCLDPRPAMSD